MNPWVITLLILAALVGLKIFWHFRNQKSLRVPVPVGGCAGGEGRASDRVRAAVGLPRREP